MFLFLFGSAAQASQQSMPKEVQLVAEKAENVIDFLLKKEWTEAQSAIDVIVRNETKVEDEMLDKGLSLSTVNRFRYLISRLRALAKERNEPIRAALNANQITALLIDLQDCYPQTTPLDISRIDYLGREIVLLSHISNSSDALNKPIIQLQDVWNTLKPTIQKHKGGGIILQMDQVISNLKKESSRSKIKKDGNRILDLVDDMEALFK